jgi:heme-degrading monooxygenase HmoA
MEAMVTRIRFHDERGPELEAEELARQRDEMQRQAGFRAFYAIRTAPDEIFLVRVYETRADLLAGLKQGRRRQLAAEFAEPPTRWIGDVVSSA